MWGDSEGHRVTQPHNNGIPTTPCDALGCERMHQDLATYKTLINMHSILDIAWSSVNIE